MPLEQLWETLSENCLPERTLRVLQQDTEFPKAKFRAHQICDIITWACAEFGIDTTLGSLMQTFNCSRGAVRSALADGFDPPESRGRHLALSAESDPNIWTWIKNEAEKSATAIPPDIKNYCRKVCEPETSRGWMDSFILRNAPELAEKKSSPQEEPRWQVPCVFLDETICSLRETVEDCPADLVLNLDEFGISDWKDRKSKKVAVPITGGVQTIHH
jgi:hypothetical protein